MKEEIDYGFIAGPFDLAPFKNFNINRFGIIPKSTPRKWCLIIDLSFPHGKSVNDGIPPESCHICCPGIQSAIDKVMKCGRGALMVKFDFKKAYRSFSVRESDRYLLGMFWKNKYHVDLALPFRCKAPNIFNHGADISEWVFGQPEDIIEDDLQHHYDDVLMIGLSGSDQCQRTLDSCLSTCLQLGVPTEDSETILQPLFRFHLRFSAPRIRSAERETGQDLVSFISLEEQTVRITA